MQSEGECIPRISIIRRMPEVGAEDEFAQLLVSDDFTIPLQGCTSDRMVIVVWAPTEHGRRGISMRKADDLEQARY